MMINHTNIFRNIKKKKKTLDMNISNFSGSFNPICKYLHRSDFSTEGVTLRRIIESLRLFACR